MTYYVDGWMIGKNPSSIGGGFTVVNEHDELVKRHTMYQNPFTNNDAELHAIAFAAFIAATGDTIVTDSQCAFSWVQRGRIQSLKRQDLAPIARKAHRWIAEKSLNLLWKPREENLAGHYNEKVQ